MDFGVLDWSRLDMPKDALGLAYENMTAGGSVPPILLLVLLLIIVSIIFIIYKTHTEKQNYFVLEKN